MVGDDQGRGIGGECLPDLLVGVWSLRIQVGGHPGESIDGYLLAIRDRAERFKDVALGGGVGQCDIDVVKGFGITVEVVCYSIE